MTQRLFIAAVTVVVFTAGYLTRTWTENRQAVPPPPAALASEYSASGASKPDPKSKSSDLDRAKLIAEIEKIRPQIEAYRGQVDEIFAEFDREFALILTAEQREKFAAHQKRWAEWSARKQADRKPLSDEDIMRARERPLTEVYWMVTITPRLERLTKEYALDAGQQSQTRALLSLRRSKFIALLDATPHPSVRLSRLTPLLERVTVPPESAK
jgi:hypothetical protein